MKTPKMRGQAFIVFNDTSCAVNAVRELQNFQLLNKPMVSGAYLSHIFHYGQNNESQHLSFSKSKSHATLRAEGQEVALNKEKRRLEKEAEKANKRTRPGDKDKAPPEPAPAPAAPPPPLPAVPPPPPEAGEPNKILFVQNLPADRTEESLSEVFSKIPGLKEVRLVPGKVDIAFVEFADERSAGVALSALQGYNIHGQPMLITFARK